MAAGRLMDRAVILRVARGHPGAEAGGGELRGSPREGRRRGGRACLHNTPRSGVRPSCQVEAIPYRSGLRTADLSPTAGLRSTSCRQMPQLAGSQTRILRRLRSGRKRFLGTPDDLRLHTRRSPEGAGHTADQHIRRLAGCSCPMLRRQGLINPWNGLINPARV